MRTIGVEHWVFKDKTDWSQHDTHCHCEMIQSIFFSYVVIFFLLLSETLKLAHMKRPMIPFSLSPLLHQFAPLGGTIIADDLYYMKH